MAALVVLLTLAVSMFVARSITQPLQRMTGTMNDLAGGKLDVEVPGIGRQDEVGEMAKAVEVFKSNARWPVRKLEAEQKEAETPRRCPAQGGHAQACRAISKARSAKSSTPFPRRPRSSKLRPVR